jgi:hypothetical protein
MMARVPAKKKPARKAAYVPKKVMLKKELGHWNYSGTDRDVSNCFGFIYLMYNHTTGMSYIGKRQFWSFRRGSMVKTGAALWRLYKSSSSHVKEAVKNGDEFSYYMLGVFDTRAWTSYSEAHLQMVFDCLTERSTEGERMWYNNQIAPIKYIPKQDDKQLNELNLCIERGHKILNKLRE